MANVSCCTVESFILTGILHNTKRPYEQCCNTLFTDSEVRLPVPGLWLDVFQKIKALGYNGVSFYVDWALLEGQEGVFLSEGIFDLNPFFDAATQAGIYLLAVRWNSGQNAGDTDPVCLRDQVLTSDRKSVV